MIVGKRKGDSMSIDLSGRVALVTGGSRGIGRRCAIRFAAAGADVIINYISSKGAATEVADEITRLGRKCFVIKADVSQNEQPLYAYAWGGLSISPIRTSRTSVSGRRQLPNSG